ncbi:hypothetical protein [Paenibacillus sp. Leaf72]|uniref:hypothetical protein n=1 Tax=Paenibacillus sp. Leaf72 TaxID=1736234 RepID=UPI0012DC6C7A|nr:hypothetical protein [Paenibacillus sp. Leaf72]
MKTQASRKLGKLYAAVKVERKGFNLHIIQSGVCMSKPNTLFADLPKEFNIFSIDGKIIEPTGRFMISTETIDPYHIIVDWH